MSNPALLEWIACMDFASELALQLKAEAVKQGIELGEDTIAHFRMTAFCTASKHGIPNEATRNAATQQYLEKLKSF